MTLTMFTNCETLACCLSFQNEHEHPWVIWDCFGFVSDQFYHPTAVGWAYRLLLFLTGCCFWAACCYGQHWLLEGPASWWWWPVADPDFASSPAGSTTTPLLLPGDVSHPQRWQHWPQHHPHCQTCHGVQLVDGYEAQHDALPQPESWSWPSRRPGSKPGSWPTLGHLPWHMCE